MLYNFDFLTFQVQSVMQGRHPAGYFEVKKRPYAVLSFRAEGASEFEIQDKRFLVNEGDVLYIPANLEFRVRYTEQNNRLFVHLTDCNYPVPELLSPRNKELIGQLFDDLCTGWERFHSQNRAKSDLYDILFRLSEENRIHNELFEKIADYASKHFCEPDADISGFCRRFGISRSRIQGLFLGCVGIPPKQYLTNLRMEKALLLLAQSKLCVREIAYACGFSDEKYFSRAFRAKYGYPPSQFRHHTVL